MIFANMRVASVDIGKKNFALCIQDFSEQVLTDCEGDKSEDEIIAIVSQGGNVISIDNLDLTEGCNPKVYLDPKVFPNMIEKLNERREILESCDVYVIEQQMSFRGARNPAALKLAQTAMTYFWINFSGKPVIEFPAFHKGQVLGAPREFGTITKTFKNGKTREIKDTLKKWAVREATRILEQRNDQATLVLMGDLRKRDDVSDTILQSIAYIVLRYCPHAGQRNRPVRKTRKGRRKKS